MKRQEDKDEKEQMAKELRIMDLLKLCNIRASTLGCPGFKY